MCAWASSSWMIETAEPKLLSAGACWAARRYAGAEINSVSAETVRIRRIPVRYSGDMCARPSISLPEARCSRTSSSLRGASSCAVGDDIGAVLLDRAQVQDVTLD